MKKLSILISLLFLVSLWGCQKKPSDLPTIEVPTSAELPIPEEPAPTEDTCEISTESPAQNVASAPALAEGPDGSLVLLLTDYFSLTLPHDWANSCVYTEAYREDGAYLVNLYEAAAYWEFGGGNLCTIMLLPSKEDYSIFPSYQYLGVMRTADSDFNLVALFPTDVQFTPETIDVYSQMVSQLPDVLSTLNPGQGVELALPEY